MDEESDPPDPESSNFSSSSSPPQTRYINTRIKEDFAELSSLKKACPEMVSQINRARERYQADLKANPNDPEAVLARANIYFHQLTNKITNSCFPQNPL